MQKDLDPTDLSTFDRFAPRGDDVEEGGGETNLADLILEKIAAHETTKGENVDEPPINGGGAPEDAVEMDPKVIQVYSTYVAPLDPSLGH